MRKLVFACFASLILNLSGSEYGKLMQEAAEKAKEKDSAAALQKYSEAYLAAGNPTEKYKNVIIRANYLFSLKKWDAIKELLEEELRKADYSNSRKQYMLVQLARPYLWSPKHHEYALDKLNLAMSMDGAEESTVLYFIICHYAATIYYHRKKEYEPVIALLEPLTRSNTHPTNLYDIHSMLGHAYARLGRKEDAVKHFKQVIEIGRKLKRNTQKTEKILKGMSK